MPKLNGRIFSLEALKSQCDKRAYHMIETRPFPLHPVQHCFMSGYTCIIHYPAR